LKKIKNLLFTVFGAILLAHPAWAWFAEGHEIVAVIAADDLTPTAKSQVAKILGVPADTNSVEKAMAAASIRPDTEFRDEDKATRTWHYIDICLQDSERDVASRCPNGNCVTAKIDRLKKSRKLFPAALFKYWFNSQYGLDKGILIRTDAL
jgi:hypothetical protein